VGKRGGCVGSRGWEGRGVGGSRTRGGGLRWVGGGGVWWARKGLWWLEEGKGGERGNEVGGALGSGLAHEFSALLNASPCRSRAHLDESSFQLIAGAQERRLHPCSSQRSWELISTVMTSQRVSCGSCRLWWRAPPATGSWSGVRIINLEFLLKTFGIHAFHSSGRRAEMPVRKDVGSQKASAFRYGRVVGVDAFQFASLMNGARPEIGTFRVRNSSLK